MSCACAVWGAPTSEATPATLNNAAISDPIFQLRSQLMARSLIGLVVIEARSFMSSLHSTHDCTPLESPTAISDIDEHRFSSICEKRNEIEWLDRGGRG
jgi:hypothetical protein